MAKLTKATNFVLEDEPCFGLYELNLQSPGSKGFHRYQILIVVRDDKLAEYRWDMGLSKHFKHDQLRIPGGDVNRLTGRVYIEHTVAELKEMANRLRESPAFDKKELAQIG